MSRYAHFTARFRRKLEYQYGVHKVNSGFIYRLSSQFSIHTLTRTSLNRLREQSCHSMSPFQERLRRRSEYYDGVHEVNFSFIHHRLPRCFIHVRHFLELLRYRLEYQKDGHRVNPNLIFHCDRLSLRRQFYQE